MRLGVVVLILLSVAFGATFGALNSDRVAFDLYFYELMLPKGGALLAALALGWVFGGLIVWFVGVRRLQRELRSAKRMLRDLRAKTPSDSAPDGTANGRS